MKNKLILILLTVFVVGTIASITAYTSLQEDTKADAVSKAKIDTKFSISAYYGPNPNTGQMNGYLKDKDKNPLTNTAITMTIDNGNPLTIKTDSVGSFYKDNMPYGQVTLKFAGNSKYNPCELSYYNDGETHKRNWSPHPDC
jgi:hypothetical protein